MFFDDALEYYRNWDTDDYYYAIDVPISKNFRRIVSVMKNSKDEQFAGLLLAYARRVDGEHRGECPLCYTTIMDEHGACGVDSPCIATDWCSSTPHVVSAVYRKALYDLVVEHCKLNGCEDVSWLPEWTHYKEI
jgi:hypothetical protein